MTSSARPDGSPVHVPWYHRPVGVLVLLFLVLGPLALPYLWKSPRFSQRAKTVLTVAVIAYTGWLVRETITMVHAIQSQLDAAGLLAP